MFFNFLNPQFILFYILFFIPSLVIHEFSHAFAAYKLGDPTAKNSGRLSLNPLVHLDLLGTISILLIGFGWAKPVPINPYNFDKPRRDSAITSFAGPLSNITIAIIGIIIINILSISSSSFLFAIISIFIQINIILAVFNLIPLGPLDGFKIVSGILPPRLAMQWEEALNQTYLLLLVFLILPINGQTIVSHLIEAVNSLVWMLVL